MFSFSRINHFYFIWFKIGRAHVWTNSIPLDKGCFKLEYTTDDYYVFCYEKVDAYNVIENGHSIDEDFYSKYDDYKLVTLTGDELNTYYSDYDKYVLNQE